MRVLLVEDARRMAEAMVQVLTRNNYSVDVNYDGQSGLDNALTGIYDAIILDIMLPVRDGISVLKELRAQHVATPVILLTAKSQTEDKIVGLDAGADDYLTKPFEMGELLARLRALGRRQGTAMPSDALQAGTLEFNPHTLTLSCEGRSFVLTRKEAQLIEMLMRNSGRTLSVQTIIDKIWGFDTEAEDRHVQVYVSFLRKKLLQLEAPANIRTVRGLGYVLLLEAPSSAGEECDVQDGTPTGCDSLEPDEQA
ncbi:MAG: response regulator transcription factor [Coriobacteriales bacterium]|jgi:DNA-binding response OmpR family regulator|nr:response regulator transcription factor [Coriobacteriales bacterium]